MVGTRFGASFWTWSAIALAMFATFFQPVPLALAQSTAAPTEAEVAEARRLFSVGLRHADRGEWQDAVVYFRQVLEVRQAPPVLFNLGAALVALGQYPEAEPMLRRVVEDSNSEASLVERANASLATMSERGGRLAITLVGATPNTVVTVDSLVLGSEQLASEFALSAGAHTIIVRDAVSEVSRREIAITAGQRSSVTLTASVDTSGLDDADSDHVAQSDRRASSTEIGAQSEAERRRQRRLRNPWLWTGVGVGVLLIGTVIVVSTYDPDVRAPAEGNTTPPLIRF